MISGEIPEKKIVGAGGEVNSPTRAPTSIQWGLKRAPTIMAELQMSVLSLIRVV